jgi:hypothetical protein
MGTVPAYEATTDMNIAGAKVFVDGNIIGYCNNSARNGANFRKNDDQTKSQQKLT